MNFSLELNSCWNKWVTKNQHKGNNFNGKKEPSSLRFRETYTIHSLGFLRANSLQNERKFQVFLIMLHRGQNHNLKKCEPESELNIVNSPL